MEKKDDQQNTIRQEILSPPAISRLEEISEALQPKPNYIGPGMWLKTIRKLKRRR